MSDKVFEILDTKFVIADILKTNPSNIKLVHIKDGCVIATFYIPTDVANNIFAPDKRLSADQINRFQSLSVHWLECGDFKEIIHYGSSRDEEENRLKGQARREGGLFIIVPWSCVVGVISAKMKL